MSEVRKTMRDVFIERIYQQMHKDPKIFFVTADLGAPTLDQLREKFCDRFLNVGIAEQNCVNVSTGLALEGYTVYSFAIAPFLSMRSCEQVRNNLALLSQTRQVNVNLVGVGAGMSYEVSGPTHHALEDISILRTLPNLHIYSPCDWQTAERLAQLGWENTSPKYIRMDAKPLPAIYETAAAVPVEQGFCELEKGDKVALLSTGYLTHTARKAVDTLAREGCKVGFIDIFQLAPLNKEGLLAALEPYDTVITLEEAFINKGGMDSAIRVLLADAGRSTRIIGKGLSETYLFEMGGREELHGLIGIDEKGIIEAVKS